MAWSERYYDAVSDRITVQEMQVRHALGILLIGAHLDAAPLGLAGRAEWADQVLVRPQLMDQLLRLDVIGTDGVEPLASRSGRPRSASLSDHLPVSFTFELR